MDAARHVWELPYGRNSDRADFRLVQPQRRVDLTRPGPAAESAAAQAYFFTEEHIEPEDIGAPKEEKHRAFIRAWAARRGLDPEHIWRVREAGITALSMSNGP